MTSIVVIRTVRMMHELVKELGYTNGLARAHSIAGDEIYKMAYRIWEKEDNDND